MKIAQQWICIMRWRECKCPDEGKRLSVWEEYSRRRVRSPLVDLTAWHKKSALVIGPPHLTRKTVTWVWQPDNWVKTQNRGWYLTDFIHRFHTSRDRAVGLLPSVVDTRLRSAPEWGSGSRDTFGSFRVEGRGCQGQLKGGALLFVSWLGSF